MLELSALDRVLVAEEELDELVELAALVELAGDKFWMNCDKPWLADTLLIDDMVTPAVLRLVFRFAIRSRIAKRFKLIYRLLSVYPPAKHESLPNGPALFFADLPETPTINLWMVRSCAGHLSLWIVCGCLVFLTGCQDYRGPVSIHSTDPDLKIVAIKKDQSCISHDELQQLVEDLDNDDPAIRFYAIQSLERITHDDFGYVFYEDDDRRAPALRRWQDWMKDK